MEQLKHGIESLSPSLLEECEKPNSDCTLRLENIMRIEGTRNSNDKRLCAIVAHLREGAVQRKTHIAMANAMESLLSPDEKFKLFGLLKFMGTSAGMLTLTGIPVALQVISYVYINSQLLKVEHLQQMPLADRVDTLTMLRDSKLAALRGAYQVIA